MGSGYGNKGGRATVGSATYYIVAAGTFTTAGGDATESIPVTGITASDIAFVVLRTAGGVARTVLTAITTTNAITVVMSGDPSTDHVLAYQVLRAA